MTRKERYNYIIEYFQKRMPEVTTELEFGTAFQLLCATLLSAQCTDKRINQVTPALFRRYPTPEEMAKAEPEDVFEFIRSVSYPNSKAKHLVEMARMIVANYGGEVPEGLDELVKLPGVGRKTANVIQAVWFGKSTMAVDTHVFRVSHRMGLVPKTANTPYKVERCLIANIPEDVVPKAHHWLLLHGRYVCTSRIPKCDKCEFGNICPKILEGSKL
ncbi:MAG: endonuclease III [Prevotella sp.]|jgi:endonuclease-3|nr:endonuclease III [Prevotella sp.]